MTDPITATTDYITDLVKIVKKEYTTDRADQIIKELNPIHDLIHDILKRAHDDINNTRKICTDPYNALPCMCRICPVCTMALDGYPMCALTRRGVEI